MSTDNINISVSTFINVTAEDVFDHWVEPEKIRTWIFPDPTDSIEEITSEPKVGGTFTFVIQRDGETLRHTGEYLIVERPDKLVFTWAMGEEEGADHVELEFASKESGTEVTLTTELHPDWAEYAEPTKKAWASMLKSLKEMIEKPVAKSAMLIRKPVSQAFEAFINPEITSKFWFTEGSGRLEEGKTVTWIWGQFDVSADITVTKIKKNKLIRFQWPSGEEVSAFRTVELSFEPKSDDTTFVRAVETRFDEDDQQLIDKIVGQTEGWALVLSALKAWLEYDINLNLISDHHPSEQSDI